MPSRVQKIKIYYADEREPVVVKVSPRALVNTERHIGGDWTTMAILSVYRMAWEAMFAADKNTPAFETWLDEIEDVEQLEEKEQDPTQPGLSGDSLLN